MCVERLRRGPDFLRRARRRGAPCALHRVGRPAGGSAAWSCAKVAGGSAASVSAAAMARSSSAAGSTTSSTRPRASATSGVNVAPLKMPRRNTAAASQTASPRRPAAETARRPEARSRRCGRRPRAAMRLSAQHCSTQPPAMAWPLTAATTGLGKKKHRVVEPVQRRQKAPHIVRAALAQPHQIDAGGEHRALPGQHDAPWRRSRAAPRTARRSPRRTRCRARWPCRGPCVTIGDVAAMRQLDHVVPRGMDAPAARRRPIAAGRGDSRSAWMTAIGQHHDADDLMQQRQRQRRLMQQRDDADAGLQGDGAGQRQRAVEHRAAAPCAHRHRRDAAPPRSTAHRPPCGD